jgi:hypothetical protein
LLIEEIKQTDALIAEADGIIAKMDSLIAGLDLPVVPLSEQQQKELDEQRALQQQKIKDRVLGLFGIGWCVSGVT